MIDEVKRLNQLYKEILPEMKTLPKCLKYLCQKESYRMLKEWSYDNMQDPLPEGSNSGEDDDFHELDNIERNVINNISEEINNGTKKSSREIIEVNYYRRSMVWQFY